MFCAILATSASISQLQRFDKPFLMTLWLPSCLLRLSCSSHAGFLCSGSWIICEDARWFCVNIWSFGDSSELFPTKHLVLIRQATLTLVHDLPLLPFFNQVEPGAAPKKFVPSRSQQKDLVPLWSHFFVAEDQFLTVETGKTGRRLGAGPELNLELLWWKSCIGPLTRLTDKEPVPLPSCTTILFCSLVDAFDQSLCGSPQPRDIFVKLFIHSLEILKILLYIGLGIPSNIG